MNVITVNRRDFAVKAKRARRSGIVPGSVFGGPLPDSIPLQIDEAALRKLLRCKREGSKLKLDLDGQLIPVQIKEKTVNTLSNEILHISFQALKEDQKVNSVIPYASLPQDMIDTITIDVDGMGAGSIVTVGDIPELKSEKIDLQIDTEEIVLRISDKKHPAGQTVEPTEQET